MSKEPRNAAERIDQLIAGLADWRGKLLAIIRRTMLEADAGVIEEWKWMGSPVWSRDGMLAVGNAHKDKVKLTFMHGAGLADPARLFNAGANGGKWRAIDLFEGDSIDERALKALIRAAIDFNRNNLKRNAPAARRAQASTSGKAKQSKGIGMRKGRST
jgi:hypothetical protein